MTDIAYTIELVLLLAIIFAGLFIANSFKISYRTAKAMNIYPMIPRRILQKEMNKILGMNIGYKDSVLLERHINDDIKIAIQSYYKDDSKPKMYKYYDDTIQMDGSQVVSKRFKFIVRVAVDDQCNKVNVDIMNVDTLVGGNSIRFTFDINIIYRFKGVE